MSAPSYRKIHELKFAISTIEISKKHKLLELQTQIAMDDASKKQKLLETQKQTAIEQGRLTFGFFSPLAVTPKEEDVPKEKDVSETTKKLEN